MCIYSNKQRGSNDRLNLFILNGKYLPHHTFVFLFHVSQLTLALLFPTHPLSTYYIRDLIRSHSWKCAPPTHPHTSFTTCSVLIMNLNLVCVAGCGFITGVARPHRFRCPDFSIAQVHTGDQTGKTAGFHC